MGAVLSYSGCSSNLLKQLAPQAHSMIYCEFPFELAQQQPEFGTQMGGWGQVGVPVRPIFVLFDGALGPGAAHHTCLYQSLIFRCIWHQYVPWSHYVAKFGHGRQDMTCPVPR